VIATRSEKNTCNTTGKTNEAADSAAADDRAIEVFVSMG
jgi:hypothetical protein